MADLSDSPGDRYASHGEDHPLGGDIAVVPIPKISMEVVPIHDGYDAALFHLIILVVADYLSAEDKILTDAAIRSLSLQQSKALCSRCKYKFRRGGGETMAEKAVSQQGRKSQMSARLLSWFYHYRQGPARGASRVYGFSTSKMNIHEDIRLLEIFADNDHHNRITNTFHKAAKRSESSALGETWKSFIAPLFNNPEYKPAQRDPGCAIMGSWDPNHSSIKLLPAEVLRLRYATLVNIFTVVFVQYERSGNNDPTKLAEFCGDLETKDDQVVWFMMKALWLDADDESFAQRSLLLLPRGQGMDSSDPASIENSLRNAAAGCPRSVRSESTASSSAATPAHSTITGIKKTMASGAIDERASLASNRAANKATENCDTTATRNQAMAARDKAEAKRILCADAVRAAPAKKKAKRIARYQVAALEHSVLARQAAELMNVTYEEENDDASFLGEGCNFRCDGID